jgi:hypothetical protein
VSCVWRFAVEDDCSVLDVDCVRVTSEPVGLHHRRDQVQGSQAKCSLLSFLLHLTRRAGKYKNRKRRIPIPGLNKRSKVPGMWLLQLTVAGQRHCAQQVQLKESETEVRSCSF